jgi:hypothetical protein
MNQSQKAALALRALERHAKACGVQVPERMARFWRSGEAFKYDGKYFSSKLEMHGGDVIVTRKLRTAVPSWEVLGQSGPVDSGVVGPGGEWEDAGDFLPLYYCGTHFFYVAKLSDPKCPVGYWEEETFRDDFEPEAASLDAFLAKLTDKASSGEVDDGADEAVDYAWEGAQEDLDRAEEEDGEEDED